MLVVKRAKYTAEEQEGYDCNWEYHFNKWLRELNISVMSIITINCIAGDLYEVLYRGDSC